MIGVGKLVEYNICRPNGLGGANLMPVGEIGVSAGASSSQASGSQAQEEELVRVRPMMTTSDRFRVTEGRMGHIKTRMTQIRSDMDEIESGIFGMSDQFESFYGDYRRMQAEHMRYNKWNVDCTSEMIASMHLDHEKWNGPRYVYVLDVPNVGVQGGLVYVDPQQHPASTSSTPFHATDYHSMDHDHFQG